MANPFDKYDVPGNYFDKYDAPEKPPVVQDRSFLGASAEVGGRALLGAAATLVDTLNPFTLSEQDAATLYKGDPEGFKKVTEQSASMALLRYANEQAKRSQEVMAQVSPKETGSVSGKPLTELEYATLDPEKAAYVSPTRVAGDVLQSLPQTLALAVTAYFTKGRSLAAGEEATAAALARGATAVEAQAAGRAAAIATGAKTMATAGAAGEGALGFAGGKTQATLEASQIKPEVYEASPDYQALLEQGYTPETARAYLTAKVGQESGLISGAVDAATNLIGGRVLGKIIGGGGPIVGRTLKGFGTEALTETVQSAGEQLGQNVSMQQINPALDLTKGVGEAAAQGFVVGGVTGGGTAAVFGSRQRDNSLNQLKGATDAGSAAIAANAAAGDMDMILRQTVDTQLAPAITADLAGAPIPTPAQALAALPQQINGNPLAAASLPERQAFIDRQAGLIAEANTPGIPSLNRENLLAQAQTARGTPAPGAAAGFVDLTPMTAAQAQTRLAVVRDTTANAGGNSLELAVVPHPTQAGSFAIAKQTLPTLDLGAPAAGPSAAQAQNQIEASALAGKETNRLAEDQPRQEIIARAMRNVQERGGVASPAEAQIFREANLGQPYDRIDQSLAPDLSVDQKLTQATGISLTNRPRETVQTKAAEVAPAVPVQAPKAATTKEVPFNAPDAVNILVDGFTKATRDWGDRGTLVALTAKGFLDGEGVTTPKGQTLLENINNSKRSNDEINADLKQALGMRTVETEAPATPYSPIDIGLMGERPFRANLGLSNQVEPPAPASTTTPEEERVDRLRSSLSIVTGGIVQTDAKLSTTREPVPGSTATINDKGTEHTYTVAESGALPGMTKLIQQLARRFGKRVVFFNSDTLKADGFVSNADNKTLFINAKSQMSPLAVFGHELLHLLKRDNPIAYRAIAAVVAKRMDTETRAQFRQDYGSGANIEELSADLMGNAFQDENFLTDVFTEIAESASEGEARGIIMRLAAAINQSIKAAMDVISKMAPGTQQFRADELVKNLEEIRGALKAALVTYAKDQKIPAMQMEAERAQAESRTALTATAASAAPEITKAPTRLTPEQKAQREIDRKLGLSVSNEQRRGTAVLASAKPGNKLATVTGRTGKDMERLHARATAILSAAPAQALFTSMGLRNVSFVTFNGSWEGTPELSFFITAKDAQGDPLTYEKTRGLGAVLASAFQQDAAITSHALPGTPEKGTPDLATSLYFAKGNGDLLTAKEVAKGFKAFNAIGEDASITPDGKAFKFLYFGADEGGEAYARKLITVANKLGYTASSRSYNRGNLDKFQSQENEDGSISRSYRSLGQQAWDSALAPGSPGVLDRATSALLVPYILAVKAEGFGFNYTRWQQVNDATREQRQQLEAAVAAADAANKHGLVPRLREKINISKLGNVPLTPLITQKTTSGNAVEQLAALDDLLIQFPDILSSAENYLKAEARAFGSNDVPVAPRNIIDYLKDGGKKITEQLSRQTPGQLADADAGFANAKEFLRLYTTKQVPIETTGKMMLWSFLSRGVSPYVQEAMFVDAVRGVEPFVKASAEGNFGPDMRNRYTAWAESISKQNGAASPGNGTTHNLNAFGATFLTRMSERMEDGRTKLQYLHDMLSDPNMTGRQIRREFVKMGEGVGIDNKVISFTLLVTGRTDVIVLDRVQMKNIYDDGSFANYNLYDGTYQTAIRHRLPPSVSVIDDYGQSVGMHRNQITDDYGNTLDEKLMNKLSSVDTYAVLEQREGETNSAFDTRVNRAIDAVAARTKIPKSELIDERAIKPGSGLASMTTGVRGLMLYESIENEMDRVLPRVYKALGRPQDAAPGRWHWESWVVTSGQEASHGTLDALLAEAKKEPNPFSDVPVKQGEYGMTDYGVRYARDTNNKQYYLYDDSTGQPYRFTPGSWREVLTAIKKTFPSKFLISMNEDRTDRTEPWYLDPRIDRNKIDAAVREIGVIDRSDGITKTTQRSTKDRVPELQQAAQGIGTTVSRAQYDQAVKALKPVTPYEEIPAAATTGDMRRALSSDKVDRIGTPSEVLKAGDPVGLRLDIPAYTNHGVWVISVHEQQKNFAAGKSIGYESVAAVNNPTFGAVEKAALKIAQGTAKSTIAVVKGDWMPMSKADATAAADAALNSTSWAQVGMDPTRHSYFYDRKTMQPIVAGDEAIMVGPLALVKNPVYGRKEDFLFSSQRAAPTTPAFKRWFGESQVVDDSGKPVVMYHATRKREGRNYTVESDPDRGNIFSTFVTSPDGKLGEGIYASSIPAYSENYARNGVVMPVYFSIKEPLIIDIEDAMVDEYEGERKFLRLDSKGSFEIDKKLQDKVQILTGGKKQLKDLYGEDLRKMLQNAGYDGILVRDQQGNFVEANAFERTQVKSAIGNNGEFNQTNPNISKSNQRQTDTPQFKNWFGDSAAVDKQGNPLVVYHGSSWSFSSFAKSLLGSATGAPSAKLGFFFAGSPNTANKYAINSAMSENRDVYYLNESIKDAERQLAYIDKQRDSKTEEGKAYREKLKVEQLKQEARWRAKDKEDQLKYPLTYATSRSPLQGLLSRAELERTDLFINADLDETAGFYKTILANRKAELVSKEAELNALPINLESGTKSGMNIMPVYLSLQNPLIMDQKGKEYRIMTYHETILKAVKDGHDGVIIKNTYDGMSRPGWLTKMIATVTKSDVPSDTIYIVFEPTQIKSAIGNNGEFSKTNSDINKSSQRFYSALAKGIDGIQTKAAPAAGWKDAIKGLVNKGAVKADEVEWSGVNDWLALQQGRVTKGQVTSYLRENGVQVTETVYGNQDDITSKERDRYEFLENEMDNGVELNDGQMREYEGLQMIALEGGFDDVETRYGKYTLPGGTNYRELLLTMPLNVPGLLSQKDLYKEIEKTIIEKAKAQRARGDDYMNEDQLAGVLSDPFAYTEIATREITDKFYLPDSEYFINHVEKTIEPNRYFDYPDVRVAKYNQMNGYKSSHWKEKNVLAHIRLSDRTDADGNKVLFVEELQSDWGQEGKKQGFKGDVDSILRAKGYKVTNEDGIFVVRDKDGDAMGDAETRELALKRAGVTTDEMRYDDPAYVAARGRSADALNAFNRANADPQLQAELQAELDAASRAERVFVDKSNLTHNLITPAPFVKNTEGWLNLALKRVMAMAVEGGYDKVAFVNGAQSADHYSLSKQVDKILYLDNGEFQAFDKQGELVVARKISNPDELEPLIGKEAAQKLLNQKTESITVKELNTYEIAYGNPNTFPGRQLSGVDLDVGGRGMKTFYDQIVPNAAKALLKKLGSSVEMVKVTTKDVGGAYDILTDLDKPKDAQVFVMKKSTDEVVAGPFNYSAAADAWKIANDPGLKTNQPGFAVTDTMREKLAEGQPLFSRQRIVGESKRDYTPEQRAFFENTGRTVTEPTFTERVKELRKDFALKMTQGMVDPFASIKKLDFKSYILARMSKGTAGALEAMLRYGKVSLNKGVYDSDMSGGFLDRVGIPLQGELEDFLWWIAANRAERLSKEDRENLFTATDIQAGKTLSSGTTEYDYTMQHGADAGKVTRDRTKIYRDSLKTFDEFNKNALDMAEQQGLIDPESRKLWEHEFYVPFYRLAEEDGSFKGGSIKDGLVRQKAFERLKGGSEKLNSDLLANTLQNWSHLLEAGAKNAAAESSLKAAEKVGAAKLASSNTPDAVWYMGPVTRTIAKGKTYEEAGVEKVSDGTVQITSTEKIYYTVSDPYILASLSAINYTGMKGPVMDAMTSFKHALTIGVTASPYYKVKNLMRDSVQAVATSPLSYNIAKNLVEGYQASDRKSQTYVSALASGGLIRFGNMLEGNEASRTRMLIDRGVDKSTILDSDQKVKAVFNKFKQAFDAYNEVGARGEEMNRAALYKQLIGKGVGHDEASFMARDLMDFSLQGTFQTVRFLTQVVPFMNARMVGLYKLGKSANEDPKRFGAVLGATALLSVGLLLAYKDDDDWKKREDWDRNNYWWFKIGGMAFRIPKPFEIGAISTLAERGLEYFISKEMTGRRLGKNVLDILGDNLSMNPIAQFAKPLLDIYSNVDSFTNRPIESMGMEKLKSEYRFNSHSSMLARGLSTAGNAVSGVVNKEFLSPVQIDHLVRGYFGWLGTFVVGGTDMILRPLTGQATQPASDLWKVASGNMVSSLPADQSRYVSQMYEQAKVLEETYATWRRLQKDRKPEEAREFLEANREKLTRYKQVEGVKKNEAKFNEMIRMVERSSTMDAEQKAARISNIKGRMDILARRVAPGYEQAPAQ